MKLVDTYLDSKWYVKLSVRCTAGFLALGLAVIDANVSHQGGDNTVENIELLAESIMRGEINCAFDRDGADWPQLTCAWGPALDTSPVSDQSAQTIDEVRTPDYAQSVLHTDALIDGFAISLNPQE